MCAVDRLSGAQTILDLRACDAPLRELGILPIHVPDDSSLGEIQCPVLIASCCDLIFQVKFQLLEPDFFNFFIFG